MQIRGEIALLENKFNTFDHCFQTGIHIKVKQIGKANCSTAFIYINYANFLLQIGNYKKAYDLLDKSAEILLNLPENHPNLWCLYYVYGCYLLKKKEYKEGLMNLKNSIWLIENKYDHSHISILKTRFKYTLALLESGNIEESKKEFEELDDKIRVSIIESEKKSKIL